MSDIKLSVIIPVYNQEVLLLRALESIPRRDDIEVIVIDDGSTDDTWDYLMRYRDHNPYVNLICLYNPQNKGVAHTVNRGYDIASGEYVVLLGSDDYFITETLDEQIYALDGTDLIYFNLEVNSGEIWRVMPENKRSLCGSVKFIRREFVGNTRWQDGKRQGEDWDFYNALLAKEPTERFTDIVVKHYNYPRKGSLTDLALRGKG